MARFETLHIALDGDVPQLALEHRRADQLRAEFRIPEAQGERQEREPKGGAGGRNTGEKEDT